MLKAMTDPSQFGSGAEGTATATAPGYPPPYPPPPGQYPPVYTDPAAPYGRHPLTGEPLSDKSKVIAGLLQLLGLLGAGRHRADLPRLHGAGHRAAHRRPHHLRYRCGHLGHHRRRAVAHRQGPRPAGPSSARWNLAPPSAVADGFTAHSGRARCWQVGWPTSDLADPHSPDFLFPACPFKALTGWNCPACGGLRMTHDLLHGDLAAAAVDNVFLLVGVPALLAWILVRWRRGQRIDAHARSRRHRRRRDHLDRGPQSARLPAGPDAFSRGSRGAR